MIQEFGLRLIDLSSRCGQVEPSSPVDFGKSRPASGAGRPLNLEAAAVQAIHVEVARRVPRGSHLAAGLPNRAKRDEFCLRRRLTQLLLELAASPLERGLAQLDFALRDRPRALIASLPERSAGVHEQDFQPSVANPMQKESRAFQFQIPCHPRSSYAEIGVRIEGFSFGTIRIDGETYDQYVVFDPAEVRLRKKKPHRRYRDELGHTPLSVDEKIPWKCERLVIGTGAQGALPVMPEVLDEAERRGVRVSAVRTEEAIKLLARASGSTNAVLHITC